MPDDRREGDRRKAPSLQWYPGDWLRDLAVRSCSLAARGLWREMLDWMHDGTQYGHLIVNGKSVSPETLASMVGAPPKQVRTLLAELETAGVFSRTSEGTIYSRRMVRDELTRKARAAGGAKSLENPNVPRPKDTSKDTQQGHPQGRDAVPSPAVAVASAVAVESKPGADAPAESAIGHLMGLVRKHLYRGDPPDGWNPARDGNILKRLLASGVSPETAAAAIEGLAVLRDWPGKYGKKLDWLAIGEKCTMRTLWHTRSGDYQTFQLALDACWKRHNVGKPPLPQTLREILAKMVA